MPEGNQRVAVKVTRVVKIHDEQDRLCYELHGDGEGNVKILKKRDRADVKLADLKQAVVELTKEN